MKAVVCVGLCGKPAAQLRKTRNRGTISKWGSWAPPTGHLRYYIRKYEANQKVGKSWEHVETAAKARVLTVIDLTKEMKILWNNFWANMLHIKSTLRPIVC